MGKKADTQDEVQAQDPPVGELKPETPLPVPLKLQTASRGYMAKKQTT
jgi:hypothetical protein